MALNTNPRPTFNDRRSAVNLGRFNPTEWDDIVGNANLKEFWTNLLQRVRKGNCRSESFLVTGGSREGKTSTISFGIKAMLCCNFNFATMNPCHQCVNCRSNFYLNGTGEWNGQVDFADPAENPTPVRFEFFPVDCSRLKESDVDDLCMKLRVDDGNLKIVYLDEVHRLVRRNIDEMLLRPMDDYEAIWIASSAVIRKDGIDDTGKIDKMTQKRFNRQLVTQRPDKREISLWLARLCNQFSIEVDDPKTLLHLADRSNRVPGMALKVLNTAHNDPDRKLTFEMVEDHIFDLDE